MSRIKVTRRSCLLWFPIRFKKIRIEESIEGDINLVVESGLISKNIEKIKVFRIKDISWNRSFSDFFFGVSNMTVYSSDASNGTLRLKNIRKGKEFLDELECLVAQEKKRNNVNYRETDMV